MHRSVPHAWGCGPHADSHTQKPSRKQQRLQNRHVAQGQRVNAASSGGASRSPSLQAKLQQAVLPFCCAAAVALSTWQAAPPAGAITTEQLLFLEAWRAVDRAYVDKSFNGQSWFRLREQYMKNEPLRTRQETYTAIDKIMKSLNDPFTRFLEPARYQAVKRGNRGSVIGVGLEVGFDQDKGQSSELQVVAPAPGGPAERAGIKPLDAVVAIDGKNTKGISLFEAGDLLQGEDGSQVAIKVRHAKTGREEDVTLTRQKISYNPVSTRLCGAVGPAVGPRGADSKLGYIRVATFNKQTSDSFRQALDKLKADGAGRLVVDLRNNGGGSFPAGVEVARMLINSGDVVLVADSQGVRDVYDATNTALESRLPLAVLVNRGTASASEVLAGAIQDNKRGTIVGEKTYGKGLIQTIVELSDGSGVAITVAKYQTPLGIDINKIGIQPDIALTEADAPPTDPANFCQFMQADSAPRLFLHDRLQRPSA